MTNSNYSGLESTFQKYKDRGFKVLAFPANNFGQQEPGSNSEIKSFCKKKKVSFDLFAKVSVKDDDQCELYKWLTSYPDEKIAGEVAWNFQKYLVGRDGKVIAMYHPRVEPDSKEISTAIESALQVEVK